MAGQVAATPTFALQPSAEQVALQTNYITDFNFLNQYLPDTYEKEFERYGNRTIASFLRMVGAEMPSNSDLIKWAEQGRLHVKYVDCTAPAAGAAGSVVFTVNDTLIPGSGAIAIRVGQTVVISGTTVVGEYKAVVTAVNTANSTFTAAFYDAAGFANAAAANKYTVFIYGSEFAKGTAGMDGSLESDDVFFENKPIILKDKYAVSGSDMAQIGWVEVTTENGATGYLWYLKSEHETRLRFDDHLETAMLEAVPAEVGSGALAALSSNAAAGVAGNTAAGSEGVFYVVNNRGNVYNGGNPAALAEWDTIISRLDKQGAIEENVVFVNRDFGFDIDDMLAAQNSYGAGGTSYGLFDNDKDMALNLGFTGFRRGYDFYKSDWKYLNDPTMRGGLAGGAGSGRINGLLVPAGSTSVYDQILGKNAKRPFLHVRYRASETEDRRYKTWITGSAGGASNSSLDAMEVHFLSERAVCTLGANNFFLFTE
tara:strand:+ start:1308 stop:2756 length:1449 start_codon:yes stop_codon:yes gene_type:complete